MKKVLVGMSGGVDSAVSAYLLKQEGYDVVGVTLRTMAGDGLESRCCEIDDARESARILGIPYYVFNCSSAFANNVIKPFTEAYIHGLTPNPCVICNRLVKWEQLIYHANVLSADYVATGHYASAVRLDNGRYTVKAALHSEKDQTYMLYRLTQEQLSRTLMPLWKYSKQEVRAIAENIGLQVASKPDSQEICFIPDGDYAGFIRKNADGEISGRGNFVDTEGRVLGTHKGIIHYTVGQRKGLGLSLGYPAYIKKICPDSNEIVVAKGDDTGCGAILCRDINLMSIPAVEEGKAVRCRVKIRYRHAGQSAVIENAGSDLIRITFDEPVRSAAPGQSAVFYDDDGCVIGGGVISEAIS